MKINKQQFKSLVKECLMEIINEGGLIITPKTYEVKMRNSKPSVSSNSTKSSFMKKMNEGVKSKQQPIPKSKPITGDTYLDNLIMTAVDRDPNGSGGIPANMISESNIQQDPNLYQMDQVDFSKFSDIFEDDKKLKKAQSYVKPN